jgi:hypothetical protein
MIYLFSLDQYDKSMRRPRDVNSKEEKLVNKRTMINAKRIEKEKYLYSLEE